MKSGGFSTKTPMTGKSATDGNLLKAGAREPSSHQTGSNNQERQVKKAGTFGKLGGRSHSM